MVVGLVAAGRAIRFTRERSGVQSPPPIGFLFLPHTLWCSFGGLRFGPRGPPTAQQPTTNPATGGGRLARLFTFWFPPRSVVASRGPLCLRPFAARLPGWWVPPPPPHVRGCNAAWGARSVVCSLRPFFMPLYVCLPLARTAQASSGDQTRMRVAAQPRGVI